MSATATRQPTVSGVGVLDKASLLLSVVEKGPATLAAMVAHSGLARPTVHRIALAMERLDLLTRDAQGRFVLGARLSSAAGEVQRDRLVRTAGPVLNRLHALTGLDALLFRRRGGMQICVAASSDPLTGAEAVPVGSAQPATAGPVAQVLLAWEEPEELYEGLRRARFTAATLALVRRNGWAHGPDAAVPGAVAIAVPVRPEGTRGAAALALTGPPARLAVTPSRVLRGAVIDAACELGDATVRARGPRGRG
ncbi:IclR family transcriptional regulator C-terminal domain-containing protein [Streptomyces sp. NPDC049555]|uniref:IclR family transcriptional regulator n=1 Tax=unclassified Streptomyces TaxID=2593676 RepID=UPI0034256EBC